MAALTADEIQSLLDDLKRAYLSGTKMVRFSDGKTQEYQSMAEMKEAIQAGETMLQQAQGKIESRVAFAQHKRGDGPGGPSCRR